MRCMSHNLKAPFVLFRWCCALLALGVAADAPAARAAEPTLREYLSACGITAGDFGRFRDDRQIAAEEIEGVRRIAMRLRDCPADSLRRMIATEENGDGPRHDGRQRGGASRIRGQIESFEAVEQMGTGSAGERLWRCVVTSRDEPRRAVIYGPFPGEQTANLPHVGQQVAANAVFVKYLPGVKDVPTPVFVAPRLQYPASGPLGRLDFDLAMLDGTGDNAPLTAADSAAFYCLLGLTRTADLDSLRHEATTLDAAEAARLYADPARQRGRLFRVAGIARRAVRVPIDDPVLAARLGTDHYIEVDLMADALQDNPLVFCTLDRPEDRRPLGGPPEYAQPVEVTGFFLKTWQYPAELTASERESHPGEAHVLQTAPLLIGPAPLLIAADEHQESSLGWPVGGLVALAMMGLGLLLWSLRQSDKEFSLRNQL